MRFACPRCNKTLNVRDELAGKRGKCPACGTALTVPHPVIAVEDAAPGRPCPGCGASMPRDAVVCISCGLDTRTGERIPSPEPAPAGMPDIPGLRDALAPLPPAPPTPTLKFAVAGGLAALLCLWMALGKWAGLLPGYRIKVFWPVLLAVLVVLGAGMVFCLKPPGGGARKWVLRALMLVGLLTLVACAAVPYVGFTKTLAGDELELTRNWNTVSVKVVKGGPEKDITNVPVWGKRRSVTVLIRSKSGDYVGIVTFSCNGVPIPLIGVALLALYVMLAAWKAR